MLFEGPSAIGPKGRAAGPFAGAIGGALAAASAREKLSSSLAAQ